MAKNDRTEAVVALSPLLTSAALEALRRHADLRSKWRDVYTGLVRLSQTGGGLVRYQPDHLIDLIVRSMEDELAARHRATPERDGRVHLEDTLQYVLTRLGSWHERCRANCRALLRWEGAPETYVAVRPVQTRPCAAR